MSTCPFPNERFLSGILTCRASLVPHPPAAAIPLIVHPIDSAVHAVLNATLRPAMRRYICQEAGGAQAGLAICDDCKR